MKEDQILENIIANGADLYVKDIHGISALHNAVMRNNIFAAKLLMHKGVRFSFKEYRTGKAEEVTSWEKVSRKMKVTIAEELRKYVKSVPKEEKSAVLHGDGEEWAP